MKRISLISNSSIQYYKFDAEVKLDFGKTNKIYFHQPFDSNILDFSFEIIKPIETIFLLLINANIFTWFCSG